MELSACHRTNYPDHLLRDFAANVLGAKRCSAEYMRVLRIILGNLSLADRIGARLRLCIDVPFASRPVMRTIIGQLKDAKLTREERWVDDRGFPHTSQIYQGRMVVCPDDVDDCDDVQQRMYIILQRAQERVDFTRQLYALGIHEEDCPY